jgi:hypothetical protein
MALLWIDGFEGYGTSVGSDVSPVDVLTRRYGAATYGSGYCTLRAGRVSGRAIQPGNSSWSIRTPSLGTLGTVITGVGFRPPSGSALVLYVYTGSQRRVWFNYNAGTGEIDVYRYDTMIGTVSMGSTSGAGLAANTWAYVEVKVTCGTSSGAVSVHVNGTAVLSLSGQNTAGGYLTYFDCVLLSGGSGNYPYYDDFYVCDNSGSANNDFLGVCQALAIFPTADAGTNAWTTSTGGTHYNLVSENPVDDDASYVESATSGQEELWNYGSLSGTIKGIQINTDCKSTTGSAYTLKTQIKSGSTDSSDSGQSVSSTSYATKMRISETDPATSSAWLAAAVNSAQFGVKVG